MAGWVGGNKDDGGGDDDDDDDDDDGDDGDDGRLQSVANCLVDLIKPCMLSKRDKEGWSVKNDTPPKFNMEPENHGF